MKLARKLFVSLERDNFYNGRYVVLNDNNYVAHFWANSDEEAIEIFENKNWGV